MSWIIIGIAFIIVGLIVAVSGWYQNLYSDIPPGPVPTFGGAFIILVGMILVLGHL